MTARISPIPEKTRVMDRACSLREVRLRFFHGSGAPSLHNAVRSCRMATPGCGMATLHPGMGFWTPEWTLCIPKWNLWPPEWKS